MTHFITAVSNRRTNYTLSKDVTIPQETIVQTIQDVIREVPSAFNMQSGKVVIAFGETHDAIWKITMDTLRKIVPPANFATTEAKITSFAAAYGTVLYFDDTPIVDNMAAQFPLYAKNFPIWAQQANGMMQFAVWTALTDLGLGVNLQHYNPLIDQKVKETFGIPDGYRLISQMPFGKVVREAPRKPRLDPNDTVKVAHARV